MTIRWMIVGPEVAIVVCVIAYTGTAGEAFDGTIRN